MYDLLNSISNPADLRLLDRKHLKVLATELREFILESVSKTGGHLASNLGAIELTIALHYVYNTPHDLLVWDVGHQSYPHKILTGRREGMAKLRMKGGLAGFPKREESEYDTFGVGHSSTSISAALGMAVASKLKGDNRHAVAIIGDGAMTAGMAFEALNNAGAMDANMLVILNDNDMSISPNVGALNNYLSKLISGSLYNKVRKNGSKLLEAAPPLHEFVRKTEEHFKGMFTPSTLFEEFGFHYFGPIDGHDIDTLIDTLNNIRELDGPRFLHVVTRKGQGYKLAENDPVLYHGVSKFDRTNGISGGKSGGKPSYTQIFGDWLCDMAKQDTRLVGITPAMREGSGMVRFQQEHPDRYFDTGIAEQHAVTFAAGLACEGMKPVVAIYSTFLQRAYDQLIHDVALQNLPVVFAIDRAGLVGADGPTHAGVYDIAYMRCIPNMTILTPADENECQQMLYTAFQLNTPTAVRYPRGTGPGIVIEQAMTAIPLGKGEIRRRGQKVALLAFGPMLQPAMQAAEALNATVVNMRFVKPLDNALVEELAHSHDLLVSIEEGCIMGGAGSAISEALASAGITTPLLQLGLPDSYIEHGDPIGLLADCGLNAAGIEQSVRNRLSVLPA
ncbi:MAG: 1-deoxy-D-xylulose-5-phosphate synthase [Pseudomonadota bacterium]|nr:1-deoxy-D-xylulose-5-phosphate synthase [Pseudomonadota bacterium]